jgi:hypothetical protein
MKLKLLLHVEGLKPKSISDQTTTQASKPCS